MESEAGLAGRKEADAFRGKVCSGGLFICGLHEPATAKRWHLRGEVRIFALERIKDLEKTGEAMVAA
jgi:hypothetical protein